MTDTRKKVREWLETFSQVDSMKDNPEAVSREIDTITQVFVSESAWADLIDATFQHVKMNVDSRAWPTASQVNTAMREIKRRASGEVALGSKRGDRAKLSGSEMAKLYEILDTARRWLREVPNIRHHALSTLEYWQEPLLDDRGKSYDGQKKAKATQ